MSKDCSHTLPGKAGVERKGTIVIAPMRARLQPAHPASRPFLRRRQADRVHALPEKSLLPPEWHGPPLRRAIRQASVRLHPTTAQHAAHHAKTGTASGRERVDQYG